MEPFRKLVAWLIGRLDYLRFKSARRRALRKARADDPNIYPMW
jgi:hypothetical protein